MSAKMLMVPAALVAALFLFMSVQGSDPINLKSLKRGQHMETRKEFERLLKEINKSDRENLKKTYGATLIEALVDLKAVLGTEGEYVCSTTKTNQIKHYCEKYLGTSETKAEQEKLPKPLRHLVLAYAMQVSTKCKLMMANELWFRAEPLVDDSDLAPLLRLISEQSYIGGLLGRTNEPGDTAMPTDFFTPEISNHRDTFFNIFSKVLDHCTEIKYVKTICELQLKPIYKSTIMPITVLEGIGINYKSEYLAKELLTGDMLGPIVGKWSKLAFLCELVDIIEGIRGSPWYDRGERFIKDKGEIKVFSEEMAPTFMGMEQLEENEYEQIKQIQFQILTHVTIGDKIYDKENKHLVRAINAFDSRIGHSSTKSGRKFKWTRR